MSQDTSKKFIDFYCDRLDADEYPIEQNMKINYGAVYVANQKIRRTCSIDFVDELPDDWQTSRFKLYYGIGSNKNDIVYTPVGVFIPVNPREIDRGVDILTTFQGVDKTQILIDSVLKEPLTFYTGQTLEACIAIALAEAGIPASQQNLEVTGYSLNHDYTFETGIDINSVCDTLIHSFLADWYFDGDGIFTLVKMPPLTSRAVLQELTTDNESIIVRKEKEYNSEDYYNSVVIVGGQVDQDPIRVYIKDDAEIARVEREITRYEQRPDLTEQSQVQDYAEEILQNGIDLPETLTLEELVLFSLEPKYLIKLDGIKYQIQEFNIPLNLQTQTLQLTRVPT